MENPETITTPSTTIILSGLDLMKLSEKLAEDVWKIGNRLTEFDKKQGQILEACEEVLNAAYAKGFKDALGI